jgi:hypothetical protein
MTRILPSLYLACVLGLMGPGLAHADLIPFSFGVFTESNELFVGTFPSSQPPGYPYPDTFIVLHPGAVSSGTVLLDGAQPLRLQLFTISWFGPPPVGPADVQGGFGLQLGFHDLSNDLSGTFGERSIMGNAIGVTVTGTVTGQFGSTLMLESPVEPTTLRLGDHLYSVRIESTSISAWGAPDDTSVYMDVTVNQVPEPSGLALGAAAALCFGVRRWQTRKVEM